MDWLTNVLDHLCKAIQINTFVTQPLNRMRQNEKNRHKNRPCKRALKLRLHTAINQVDFVSWCMFYLYEGNEMHSWENNDVLSWVNY